MHRTQIYLKEDQMQQLELEAEEEQLAISELIRRAIDQFLKMRRGKIDWNKDSLSKAVGGIKLQVEDASERHDEYLYGRKRKR